MNFVPNLHHPKAKIGILMINVNVPVLNMVNLLDNNGNTCMVPPGARLFDPKQSAYSCRINKTA